MADRNVQVLTPATNFDLMTLDEAKQMLGISLTDTSDDAQLALFIDINSATISRLCNRVFAREEVSESWRELNGGNRVFLSHWPVKHADIEAVESVETPVSPDNWELEEDSGKVSFFGVAAGEPVTITYWGGFNLPDEAPGALKHALAILNLQSRLLASLGTIGGIHQLSHKEARISFHDPAKILAAAMGQAGQSAGMDSPLMQVLSHFIRYEV
jgi:hypothetical protein